MDDNFKEKFADFLEEELKKKKLEISDKAIFEAVNNCEDKTAIEIQRILFDNDDKYKDITLQSDFAITNMARNCIRIALSKAKGIDFPEE